MRPLALRGRKQARAVAEVLVTHNLIPDAVLVSSAVRTKQTWEILAGGFDHEPAKVSFHDDLYVAGVDDVLKLVATTHGSTVLVVGHEPTMSAVAEQLAGDGSSQDAYAQVRLGIPTATLCVLESDQPFGQWEARGVTLTQVIRPEQ